MMGSSIRDIFFSHHGNQIDKWEHYIEIYDIEMMRFAQSDRPISLLEIGVQNGGSLELWGKFLPQGSKIYGVDIDPRVAQLRLKNPNIQIDVLDGTSDQMLEKFLGKSFDVIIDDGSHVSDNIVESFRKCFQLVKPGGLYIIEDLHAAYYESHGGGILEPKSAMVFLKNLIDALHTDYFYEEKLSSNVDVGYLRQQNRLLARITFYDSVTVIEKLVSPKVEPYRRILSGVTQDAIDMSRWLKALPRPQLATLRLSSAAAEQVDHRLVTMIERLESERVVVEHRNTVLETRIAALESVQLERDAKCDLSLKHHSLLFQNEIAQAQAHITSLEATLKKQELLLDQERQALMSVREQLGAANELATTLENQLDHERADAHRTIDEMRGKLDRSYAAWVSRKMALERLKLGRGR